jgi:hypothetical protein
VNGNEKSFNFDMELWHWSDCKVNMAVTDYYYAVPGAKDTFKPLTAEQLAVRSMLARVPPKVAGALEGEKMKIVKKTGTVELQNWKDGSDGVHMWWRDGKPDDELVLGFDVPKAGKYEVVGRFLKAVDYGIVPLSVNGEKAGQPIDLYNEGVVLSPVISLGTFELKEGENQLSAVIIGANEKAEKKYMFGLDYLILKPVK